MIEDSEELIQKKYSWFDVPRSIWYFLGRDKFSWVSFNILLFTIFFYNLVPPFILGKIVDFFTKYHAGDSLNTFYYYTFFVGLSSIVVSIIRLTSKNKLKRIAISAKTTARVDGFEKLMDFSLQWHSNENTGNKIQRIFNGSQSIPQWTQFVNQDLFLIITSFIGVLTVFAFLSPIFLVFLVTYSIIYFLIEYIFNKKLYKLSEELNILREKSSGRYIEGSGNILAIKALGAEKGIYSKIKVSEEDSKKIEILKLNTGTQKWYWFQTLNGLSLIVFLFIVASQFISGAITVGYILVFYTYYNNLRDATNRITEVSGNIIQLKSDLLRMMPIFLEKPNIKTGLENFPTNWKSINIVNADFNYQARHVGLNNLNLIINKNEKIGIAGESGSGKSTLVKIILGLYKLENGEFKVGDKNYYDISHEKIMKNISVVLQETELFNLSLLENITLMRKLDLNMLKLAIDISCLQDVIDKLPSGLDTLIGEKGYSLSGGERQRIGIARAIYKNAPIIIFDEATSSLDSMTEKKIIDQLFLEFGANKTFIIIAHRVSTLKNSDRVLVFEKGRIIEEGKYHDLIKNKKSHFEKLYLLQNQK